MARLPSHQQLLARVAAHRAHWGPSPPPDVVPEPVADGQESVWDYPRPPAVREVPDRIRVVHQGHLIADSWSSRAIVETAGAPVYYVPPVDVRTDWLQETNDVSVCEWKGAAVYFDLAVGDIRVRHLAFAYPEPLTDLGRGYEAVAGWFGFYAGRVDAALVGEELARPQPGGLYAGWVTSRIRGPIKGAPGTAHW